MSSGLPFGSLLLLTSVAEFVVDAFSGNQNKNKMSN
jgi:hypothetical protein